jgi:hypothetical protein
MGSSAPIAELSSDAHLDRQRAAPAPASASPTPALAKSAAEAPPIIQSWFSIWRSDAPRVLTVEGVDGVVNLTDTQSRAVVRLLARTPVRLLADAARESADMPNPQPAPTVKIRLEDKGRMVDITATASEVTRKVLSAAGTRVDSQSWAAADHAAFVAALRSAMSLSAQ